jgi:hypothetical protein
MNPLGVKPRQLILKERRACFGGNSLTLEMISKPGKIEKL